MIGLVVVLVATYFGFTKDNPFDNPFNLKVAFETSNNIRTNSPVRIAGVNVGKVTGVDRSDGDEGAVVTVEITEDGQPIHADAQAAIRPRIFLEGNFFIDLQPGTPSSPVLDDGDAIGIAQTSTPVQLDQVLTALQSDTRADLQTVLREYSSALEGRGAQGYRDSLQYWKPAYRDSAIVADASLGEAEHDLSRYIASASKVVESLDRSPAQLQALISDFDVTAGAFARSDDNLRAAVAELPRTLRAAQPALAALNEAFPPLRSLAVELRPGVRSSLPAIRAGLPLVEQLRGLVSEPELRGLLGDLRPTIPHLTRLSERSVPLFEQVSRASSCQNEVILPWSQDTVGDQAFPAELPVFQEATRPLPGLAGESRSGDANGQWFRMLVAGGTNLVTLKPGVFATTALPINGANPPRPDERPPLDHTVPCETQEAPNLDSEAGPPPPQRQVDVNDPVYRARYEFARNKAVQWLKRQLRVEGLDEQFGVATEDVSAAVVNSLAAVQGATP